jgi:hypothetical protein
MGNGASARVGVVGRTSKGGGAGGGRGSAGAAGKAEVTDVVPFCCEAPTKVNFMIRGTILKRNVTN